MPSVLPVVSSLVKHPPASCVVTQPESYCCACAGTARPLQALGARDIVFSGIVEGERTRPCYPTREPYYTCLSAPASTLLETTVTECDGTCIDLAVGFCLCMTFVCFMVYKYYVKPRPSGLKWAEKGPLRPTHQNGRELTNSKLAAALLQHTDLTPEVWRSFGIADLRFEDFIKVGDLYFQPAAETASEKSADSDAAAENI